MTIYPTRPTPCDDYLNPRADRAANLAAETQMATTELMEAIVKCRKRRYQRRRATRYHRRAKRNVMRARRHLTDMHWLAQAVIDDHQLDDLAHDHNELLRRHNDLTLQHHRAMQLLERLPGYSAADPLEQHKRPIKGVSYNIHKEPLYELDPDSPGQ